MSRKEELLKMIGDNEMLKPVVEEIVYLEEQLVELRKNNFRKYKPGSKTIWKPDEQAIKQYKEFSQILDSKYRLIARVSDHDVEDEESPLRKWVKKHV